MFECISFVVPLAFLKLVSFSNFKASNSIFGATTASAEPSENPSNIFGGSNTSSNMLGPKPAECMFILSHQIAMKCYSENIFTIFFDIIISIKNFREFGFLN